jgi:hypothetical protein
VIDKLQLCETSSTRKIGRSINAVIKMNAAMNAEVIMNAAINVINIEVAYSLYVLMGPCHD